MPKLTPQLRAHGRSAPHGKGKAVACLAVSKRSMWLLVALALVFGGAAGFAWHAPGTSGTWTEIRTWVGFVVVIIGAGVALYQLMMQRQQLEEQHQLLKEEAERNKRRDALLDGQLRELEQRALMTERQQADAVDLRSRPSPKIIPSIPQLQHGTPYTAEVANGSRRPIRNVACRIELVPGDSLRVPTVASSSKEIAERVIVTPVEGVCLDFVRAGTAAIFVFPFDVNKLPEARMIARFTDDGGLHWQLDTDLHLGKLASRDDW
jgi:hypothetical protein